MYSDVLTCLCSNATPLFQAFIIFHLHYGHSSLIHLLFPAFPLSCPFCSAIRVEGKHIPKLFSRELVIHLLKERFLRQIRNGLVKKTSPLWPFLSDLPDISAYLRFWEVLSQRIYLELFNQTFPRLL